MVLTKRFVSAGAERYLGVSSFIGKGAGYSPVGDDESGLLRLVDYMGGDATVTRVATAGHGIGIFGENVDERRFHTHLAAQGIIAPFRSVQFQFCIQAPIEVALSFVYDPSVSVNEYSGRYSVMIDTSHTPSIDSLASQLHGNDTEKRAERIHDLLRRQRSATYAKYQGLIELDLARELARVGLGIDNDTRFYWKIDLFHLAQFVRTQRKQHEAGSITSEYVEAVVEIVKASAPSAWKALMSTRPGEMTLTMPRDEDIVDPPLSPAAWDAQKTKRTVVPQLEEILFVEQRYLEDGGFQVVDYLGDDTTPAIAARTSYGRGTTRLSEDRGLIRTLVRDAHTSPIEMTSFAFEAKTPVFVDPRQAARHRTLPTHGFMGYTPLGSRFFVPSEDQLKYQDRTNRQGRGKDMDPEDAATALKLLRESFGGEQGAISELRELGAPQSVVRSVKGVGFYTRRWRVGDGHNLSHFLGLRLDAHAQKEIRDFAALIDDAHRRHTPTVNEALRDYKIDGMNLSRMQVEALAARLDLEGVNIESLEIYRSLGFVKKRKMKGEEEEFLNLDGQGLQKKLRRFRDLRHGS